MAKKTIQNESRTPRKRADNAEQMPVAELGPVKTLPVGTKLERHLLSAMYPSMPDDQASGLENSLRTKGQINPIVLYKGKVIDGWERYMKLLKLGMPIMVVEYTGDDPAGYVLALNSCRKSFTAGQRLFVAARMTTLKPGEKTKSGSKEVNLSISLDEASKMTGLSASTVKKAKKILDAEDEGLIRAVEEMRISVDMACRLIGKDEDDIQKVLNSDNPKQTAAELLPERGKSNGGKSSGTKLSVVDDSAGDDDEADDSVESPVTRPQRTAVQANKSSDAKGDSDSGLGERLFGRVLKDYEKLEPAQKEVFRDLILGLLKVNTSSSDQDDGDQDENDEGDDVRLLMETLDDDDESDLDDQEEEYDDDEDSEEQDDVDDEEYGYDDEDEYDDEYPDEEFDEDDDSFMDDGPTHERGRRERQERIAAKRKRLE